VTTTETSTVFSGELDKDTALATERLSELESSRTALPPKASRSSVEQQQADDLLTQGSRLRNDFMTLHTAEVYDRLTDGYRRELRVSDLAYAASEQFPLLVPTREAIAEERQLPLKHKDGASIAQGIFVSHVLNDERAGFHLIHSMTQPTPEAVNLLSEFRETDRIELGTCYLERVGEVGYLTLNHQKYLNAEDDESTYAMEVATDIVLLDDRISVGVLRGAHSEHRKYTGRRVFDSGVNLTKLYHGQVSLIEFFIERELGLLNKWYRGHSLGDGAVSTVEHRREKPWVAGVETHAIGGGCQYLLVMDRVVAQAGSYFNLPARKEGFIPGCGNLRLPRFVGERVTRQGIFFNREIYVDSPEGRLVVDDIVTSETAMDTALEHAAHEAIGTGPVGVNANRTQMRVGVEPIQVLQRYVANMALGQAYCMSSPAIIRNLELAWDPKRRGGVK
jgi:thioesterase DpgC